MSLDIKIFSGSSHPDLANEVAKFLHVKTSPMALNRFACNEIYVRPEESVRGSDVYVFQTCTGNVNEDLMELFIILDALKRSFAEKVHVIMPYLGYARQDRIAQPREAISAKLVANLISAAGADHIVTVCLHSDQEQGFFDIAADNLSVRSLFVDYFKKKKIPDLMVVAPDTGATKIAKRFADSLGVDLAILHKVRPAPNVSEVTQVIGDVMDKTCIIYDDLIDTGGTVVNAREALQKKGANEEMYLAATHGLFSDPAVTRLKAAHFREVVVTNTIPIDKSKKFEGLTVLSVAPLLARVIDNVHKARSVSIVFN
jgi:ribose-phosphate pyrophosphokinase